MCCAPRHPPNPLKFSQFLLWTGKVNIDRVHTLQRRSVFLQTVACFGGEGVANRSASSHQNTSSVQAWEFIVSERTWRLKILHTAPRTEELALNFLGIFQCGESAALGAFNLTFKKKKKCHKNIPLMYLVAFMLPPLNVSLFLFFTSRVLLNKWLFNNVFSGFQRKHNRYKESGQPLLEVGVRPPPSGRQEARGTAVSKSLMSP